MKKYLPARKLLLALCCLNCSLYPAHAQTLLSATRDLPAVRPQPVKAVKPLTEVLETLEGKYKVYFSYDRETVERKTVASETRLLDSIEEELRLILRPLNLRFEKQGDNIYNILPAPPAKKPEPVKPAGKPSASAAVEVTITGRITDEAGSPLPGVTVVLKGTSIGTTTSPDGTYSLSLPATEGVLVFSFIGFVNKEIALKSGQTTVNVALTEDAKALEEVVVVGYGTTKKINLTGAVSQVSAKELEDRPVSNLTQALQGVVPNLNVVFGSGKPGQSGSLNVRGNTSINGGSPLVLIDGVPGDLDRVNTFDVESISVLKDASASAVYGARAAFGVILVTTKNAKKGETKVTYSNNFGFKTHLTNTDFMTSGYWNAKINDEAMYNALGSTNTRYTEEDYAELLARVNDKTEHPDRPWVVVKPNAKGQDMYRYYGNFDWYNYMFSKWRARKEHNISLSGATNNIRYLISGNHSGEDGVWKVNPDAYKRYNLRAKIDVDVTKWLKFGNNTRFFKSAYEWYGLKEHFPRITNNIGANHLYHFMPAYVPRNPDGTLTGYTGINSYSIGYGMHAIRENGKSKGANDESEFISTFEATATPLPGLSITGNYTYSQETLTDYYRAVRVQYSKFPGVLENFALGNLNKDQLEERIRPNQYQVFNIYSSYEKNLGRHYFKVMGGFNQEERKFKTISGTGYELLSETLNDLNLATGEPVIGGGASEWALRGTFYRVNYDFGGKYLFEASGRYDGTSRFGKKDRFGFFPSFSVGWLLSQEHFFKPLENAVNTFKLRYSYGTLGNQDVATYAYISSMSTGRINYLVDGQKLNVVNNPAPVAPFLTWEQSVTNNIGLDASFLANRLSLTADAYVRETKDMLTLGKTLPKVFGASEPRQNAADLRTRGFEIALNWKDKFNLAGSAFTYSVGGVLADYTAEITRFDNPNNLLSNYYVGQRLGDIWGYSYDGFFKTTQEAQEYAARVNQDPINKRRVQAPTAELKKLQAGDIKILDLDNSGRIDVGANTLANPGDRRIIGNSQPRYSFGGNFSAGWKSFDVSAFFQGIGKQNWYPHLEAQQFWHAYARPYGSFFPENFQDMIWSPENPDAYFPFLRGYAAQNSELSVANDMYLQDLSYLRLKNLTLGYTLPEGLSKKIKAERFRVYVSGENIHTWTKLETDYMDPEEVMTDPTGRTYPMAKTYTAGLQVTF